MLDLCHFIRYSARPLDYLYSSLLKLGSLLLLQAKVYLKQSRSGRPPNQIQLECVLLLKALLLIGADSVAVPPAKYLDSCRPAPRLLIFSTIVMMLYKDTMLYESGYVRGTVPKSRPICYFQKPERRTQF